MNTFCAWLIARIYHLWNKWTGGDRRLLYGILDCSYRIETLSWYICNNLALQMYGRCEFFSCFSQTNRKQPTKNEKAPKLTFKILITFSNFNNWKKKTNQNLSKFHAITSNKKYFQKKINFIKIFKNFSNFLKKKST